MSLVRQYKTPNDSESIGLRRLRALKAAADAVNRSSRIDEIVSTVLKPVVSTTGLTCGVLYLKDDDGRLVGRGDQGFRGGLQPGIDLHLEDSQSLPSRAFRSADPVVFDVRDRFRGLESITDGERRAVKPEGLQSAVMCRIETPTELHGVLALCSHDDDDVAGLGQTVEFAQDVAGQIAIALDRARAHESVLAQAASSQALCEIGRMFNAHIAPEDVLDEVLDFACESLGLAACGVDLVPAAQTKQRYFGQSMRAGDAAVSALSIRLSAEGHLLGHLRVKPPGTLTSSQRLMIGEFADVLSAALWKWRMYRDSRALGIAEERGRLATEIHDTLSQRFYAIQLHLSAIDRDMVEGSLAERHIQAATGQARQGLDEARQSVRRMWHADDPHVDIVDRLRLLAEEFQDYAGIPCSLNTAGDALVLSPDATYALVRVIRELLRNISKHAAATSAAVDVTFTSDRLRIVVKDDGAGMTVGDGVPQSSGFGLRSVIKRLHSLGGRVEIQVPASGGTRVELDVPVSYSA